MEQADSNFIKADCSAYLNFILPLFIIITLQAQVPFFLIALSNQMQTESIFKVLTCIIIHKFMWKRCLGRINKVRKQMMMTGGENDNQMLCA